MGERSKDAYRLNFDRKLELEFHALNIFSYNLREFVIWKQ